jgi:hypothetical protein
VGYSLGDIIPLIYICICVKFTSRGPVWLCGEFSRVIQTDRNTAKFNKLRRFSNDQVISWISNYTYMWSPIFVHIQIYKSQGVVGAVL